jgi:hypothetical protein
MSDTRVSLAGLSTEQATAFRCAFIAWQRSLSSSFPSTHPEQAIARIYDLNLDSLYAAKWSDIKPEGNDTE